MGVSMTKKELQKTVLKEFDWKFVNEVDFVPTDCILKIIDLTEEALVGSLELKREVPRMSIKKLEEPIWFDQSNYHVVFGRDGVKQEIKQSIQDWGGGE